MKKIIPLLLILFSMALFKALSEEKKPAIESLFWLSGCWDNGDTLRHYEEQWMKPAGNSMLGMSRTVAKGKTSAYEFLRIQQQKNGDIFYVANPSGQPQDSFKLVKFGNRELIFENLAHDFPQRIIYRIQGDLLVARIEGKNKGKERGIDFPMKRTQCD